jgi:glycosyltransferase involved in cell wall biosynthesis
VVLPAYGEQRRIAASVVRLRTDLATVAADGLELIVVDDGSHDATSALAAGAGADRVIRLPVNRGKGAAVRAGVLAAAGRVVAFTDADLSYPPAQLLRLLHAVEEGADVVVGSRHHIDTTTLVRAGRLREVGGRVFNLATRLVLRRRYGDTQCGLKAFSAGAGRLLFERGRLDGFAFDVELLYLAERLGLRVREMPVELASAEGSTVHLSSDALRMLGDLVRVRRWARAGAYDGPAPRPQGRRDEGAAR